jgi:hypothetical protein
MVKTAQEADLIYDVSAFYGARRPGTGRTANLTAAKFAENPDQVETKSNKGGSFLYAGNFVLSMIASVIKDVSDAIGTSDSFNKATVGDPDGKCLTNCESWKYIQTAVVGFGRREGKELKVATTKVVIDGLQPTPKPLFEEASKILAQAIGLDVINFMQFIEIRTNQSSDSNQPKHN